MRYFTSLDFADRTLELYHALKAGATKYDFTFAAGTLLNVFTTVRPDDREDYNIDLQSILNQADSIPQFKKNYPSASKEDLIDYFATIRNGLAHKTKENYAGEANEQGIISELHITAEGNKPRICLNLNDLETILNMLGVAVKAAQKKLKPTVVKGEVGNRD